MTKQAKRRLIPLIVLLAAGGVLAAVVFSPSRTDPETAVAPPTETPPAAVESSTRSVPLYQNAGSDELL